MSTFPNDNGNRAPDLTDPKGQDAQDKRVDKMHQAAHSARKDQRNALHSFGKKQGSK